MARKILIAVLIGCMCLGGMVFWGLHTPKAWEFMLMRALKGRFAQVDVRDITIEAIHWPTMGQVVLSNVQTKIKIKGASYFFSVGRIELTAFKKVHLEHAAIVSDSINASDVAVDANTVFKGLSFQQATGQISATSVDVRTYTLGHLNSQFDADLNRVVFTQISSEFYKGLAAGDVTLSYNPKFKYAASLDLNGVDLKELSEADPKIFGDMEGLVSGKAMVRGSLNSIWKLNANLKIPGGKIGIKTFRLLTQVLPKGRIQQPWEDVVSKLNAVPIKEGLLSIETNGRGKYKGQVNINSPEAYLDLKYTYDLNVPDGLMNLIKAVSLVFQK